MTSPARQKTSWTSSLVLATSALLLPRLSETVPGLVAALLAATALAFLAVFVALRSARRPVLLLLLVAIAGRLVWIDSEPVREDDFYRYLWDGNALLAGVDPYRYTPHDVLGAIHPEGDLARLDELAREQPEVFARISHGDLATIYPPLSLAVFAGIQAIAPWRLEALRWTFLAMDIAVIGLLASILARAGRSPLWAALYGWHPLVAKEFINSAHHDVIALLPLVGFLWLWQRNRTMLASAFLGLAVLAKLFAVVTVPVYLAALDRDRWRAATCFGTVVALGYLPFAGPHMFGSLGTFAGQWRYNDGTFRMLTGLLGSALAARVASALLLAVVVALLTRRPSPRACGRAIAALFLLSPVQHPWYALWFLPFLAIHPSGPLLLMTATVSLYYLHFLGESVAVLWIEYLPVWAWLVFDFVRARVRRHPAAHHTDTQW